MGLFALQDPQLLAEEQEFNVLILLSPTRDPDEVDQRRSNVRQKQEDHNVRQCRNRADQRTSSANHASAGRSAGQCWLQMHFPHGTAYG
jgi:hypothetical protein